MIDLSLLRIDSIEVAHAARTLAYVAANRNVFVAAGCDIELLACDCCDLGDGPFTTPVADAAPWYTADDPASGEYLGMILTGTNLNAMNADRTVVDNPVRGGIAGRQHEGGQTATFRARVFATTARGMDYGRRWVAWTFRNLDCGPCGDGIDGQHEASFLAWCDADGTAPDCLGERVLVGVKLAAGPTFTAVGGDSEEAEGDLCSRYAQDVTFAFASPSPYLFGPTDCEDDCLDAVSLYAGDASSTWGDGAAIGQTRELGVSVINDAKVTAASIWGKPAADYFDGVGDTGGDIQPGGTWSDPDHATRRTVVLAAALTQPAPPTFTRITKLSVLVEVEYVSRSKNWPWDFALTIVDGDGDRISGTPQGNIVGESWATEGTWKATPGSPQTFGFTVVHPDEGWTVAEVAAFRVAYAARSRTAAAVPDELTVTDVTVWAQGWSGDGTPCDCSWCRDFCRHTYECCQAVPPDGTDAVPIITVTADDEGVDMHVEVVEGLATSGGAVEATDSFGRANSPSLGSTDGGTSPPLPWTELLGTAEIATNQLVATWTSGAPVIAFVDPAAVADATIEVDATILISDVAELPVHAGLVAHLDTSSGDGLILRLTRAAGPTTSLELSETVGGIETSLWSAAVGVSGDRLGLECVGTDVTVTLNGVAQTTVAYDGTLNAFTAYGIYAKVDGADPALDTPIAAFDDFSVGWEGALTLEGCDPDADEWRCGQTCASLNMWGAGTLVLDGRLRMAFPSDAVRGDGDGPFRWPDACCGPLCICVAARGIDVFGSDAAVATVTVQWVRRYLV